ncbi:hypothetical protein NMY22_g10326 [Coprinellus aureogranulatus]|nr:hypothetical protein NMY22_g10326 [Coprinellus aureogranulatus]
MSAGVQRTPSYTRDTVPPVLRTYTKRQRHIEHRIGQVKVQLRLLKRKMESKQVDEDVGRRVVHDLQKQLAWLEIHLYGDWALEVEGAQRPEEWDRMNLCDKICAASSYCMSARAHSWIESSHPTFRDSGRCKESTPLMAHPNRAASIPTSVLYILSWTIRLDIGQTVLQLCIPASLVVFVHHLGTAFGPRLFPIRQWMDVCLTGLEVIVHWYMTARLIDANRPYAVEAIPESAIIALVFQSALILSLTASLVLKITGLRRTCGCSWFDKVDVARVQRSPWWRYPAFAMFGRRLWASTVPGESRWASTVPGESRWVSVARGLLALFVVATMAAFGTYQMVVSPIVENGVMPYRELRGYGLNGLFMAHKTVIGGNWTVVVTWNGYAQITPLALEEAVNVEWSYYYIDTGSKRLRSTGGLCDENGLSSTACFQARPDTRSLPYQTAEGLLAMHVQIDFTQLLAHVEGEEHLINEPFAAGNAAHVYVGLAENFDPAGTATPTIRVFPGTHLLSVVEPVVRQRLKWRSLASLGLENYDTSIILVPVYTIPSPTSKSNNPNISTLTISVEDIFNKPDWIVVQDYRSKSVLDGLSAVGGLGSFLSTLLAILVGTSLMTALVHTKPYSPFGMLHSRMAEKIAGASKAAYPELEAEIEGVQRNPGVVAFLLDTMIDIELLGYRDVRQADDGKLIPPNEQDILSEKVDEESVGLVPKAT